jgi:hypothetical protein
MTKPKHAAANATTYLHVTSISRAEFEKLRDRFPEPYRAMKAWTYWDAVRQYMVEELNKAKDGKLRDAIMRHSPQHNTYVEVAAASPMDVVSPTASSYAGEDLGGILFSAA